MRRWRVPLTAIALLVGALVAAELLTGHSGHRRPQAPALPSESLTGGRPSIASLHGTPAVINFWASWCPPCNREAPAIQRLATALHGRARLVGVDWNDTRAGALRFIRRHRWTFPNVRDASGTVGDAYGIQGLPTTVVLDADGRILQTLRGPQTPASIEAALRTAER